MFTEDLREVAPGSGEVGFVARSGAIPRGYYKDPEKTAKTFPVIDGVRYSMPGDYCRVEADGTLTLLGRGSVCINTAGEKVYPEEVEEVLKSHAGVVDALVVGVPDEKWGQMVTGVIQLESGAAFDEAQLHAHVRGRLAGYKTPKRILVIDNLGRASNGKADYKSITEFARTRLGSIKRSIKRSAKAGRSVDAGRGRRRRPRVDCGGYTTSDRGDAMVGDTARATWWSHAIMTGAIVGAAMLPLGALLYRLGVGLPIAFFAFLGGGLVLAAHCGDRRNRRADRRDAHGARCRSAAALCRAAAWAARSSS